MSQTMTARDKEHEERNLRQCIALWRACGDSDHDIKAELLLRGHADAECDYLMRPLCETDYSNSCESIDRQLLQLLAQMANDIASIKTDIQALRSQVRQ